MVGYVEVQQAHEVEVGGAEELCLVHPADPVVLELNRLQNLLRDKDRELGIAQGEIKAQKSAEAQKDKALEELRIEVNKLEEKVILTQNLLDQKNLETKKLAEDKKDALAAQYAAEAKLRQVYASQKEDEFLPLESIIAPFEADIKMYRNEILALQEDKKALERLTKAKESALLEAERILRSALERALIVEEVQNQNYELRRQIEICQEENKILEKTNRQKVLEVEKLSKTIQELEEVILASGAAANTIRDYKRKISELNDEKRTLERELARAKVSANRVATVVANEWKDDNDKVMPVKQWLEERRLLQAEMQKLRDKLAISERTAKAEAQLKEKLKLRLKTLEDGLKQASTHPFKTEKSSNILGFLTNNSGLRRRSSSQPRGLTISRSSPLKQPEAENRIIKNTEANNTRKMNADGENLLRRNLWTSRSKIADSSGKENNDTRDIMDGDNNKQNDDMMPSSLGKTKSENAELLAEEIANANSEDMVSGFLYDRLQKEVINLRKCCAQKDDSLNAKDEEIKVLMKKVGALTKSLEVENKKAKREAAGREKEGASTNNDDSKRNGNTHFSKRLAKAY